MSYKPSDTYLFKLFFHKIPTSQLHMYCFVPPSSIYPLHMQFLKNQSVYILYLQFECQPFSPCFLAQILFFVFAFLHLFMCCDLFLIVHPTAFLSLFLISIRFSIFLSLSFFRCCALFLIVYPLGNNMELPRKSETMTRTWCILFLVLSPSCYSPSVLHVLRSFLNRLSSR